MPIRLSNGLVLGQGAAVTPSSTAARRGIRLNSGLVLGAGEDDGEQPTALRLSGGEHLQLAPAARQRTREPESGVGAIFDFLSRGQYASTAFVDALLQGDGTATSLGRAFAAAGKELFSPQERLSYSDLLTTHAPNWAAAHPAEVETLGLAGDIALDPTTYLSFGASGVRFVTTGGKVVLNSGKVGEKAVALMGKLNKASVALREAKDELAIAEKTFQITSDARRGLTAEESVKALTASGGPQLRLAERAAKAQKKVEAITNNIAELEKQFGAIDDTRVRISKGDGVKSYSLTKKGEKKLGEIIELERVAAEEGRLSGGRMFIQGPDGIEQKVVGRAVRESAERKFSRIISNPELSAELIDRGGVKFAGKTMISGERIEQFMADTGLTRAWQGIKNLPSVKALRHTFNRNADLPAEYLHLRQTLEAELLRVDGEVKKDAISVFGKLNQESRDRIGSLASRIDDASRLEAEQLGRPLTPGEGVRIVDQMIQDSRMAPEEVAAFARMRHKLLEIGEIEQAAGLLEKLTVNYSPRRYMAINQARDFVDLRRAWYKRLSNFHTADQQRKFKTTLEAIEEGYEPVKDAAVLYTLRSIESRKALAIQDFNQAAMAIFDDGSLAAKTARQEIGKAAAELKKAQEALSKGSINDAARAYRDTLAKHADNLGIPEAVKLDITYIGEGLYSAGARPEVNTMLRMYDKMMSVFRKSATVIRPAFGARQIVSNSLQGFVVQGVKAFGAFDVRSVADTLGVLEGHASKFTLRSALGHHYTGDEIANLAADFGILRNTSIENIGKLDSIDNAQGVAKYINRDLRLQEIDTKNGSAAAGLARFLQGAARYTDFPAKIEDISRLSLFINGLRIGHSPRAAAEITTKALFDYANGLSAIEARVARRIIPFYSFQRFALPMMAEMMAKNPGRIVNMKKTAEHFFSAWEKITNGETLSESARAAVPGYLLEQPHVFAGLDERQKAKFKTFNNFTPTDVFGFIGVDEKGEFDLDKTLKHAFLAQITPFLKVPLEFLVKENFFNGRELPDYVIGARSKAGKLDADATLSHLLSIVGAEISEKVGQSPLVGAAVGQAAGRLAGFVPDGSEQILKAAIGWEEGVDKNGERAVWINPYLLETYVSASPALSEAFKLGREDRTPLEKAMQFLFGVGTTKLDLKEQAGIRIREMEREKKEIVSDMRRARREKRLTSYDFHQQRLEEFMDQMREEAMLLSSPDIPGE